MTHYYETKIGKIIEKYADARMDGAIISYIFENGIDRVSGIPDSRIDSLTQEQCGMIGVELWKGCLRAAREIALTCTLYDDIFPYIRKYIGINGCQIQDLTLYKSDYRYESSDVWNEIVDKLDLEKNKTEVDVIVIKDERED